MEAFNQRAGLGIRLGVEPLAGMAVAGEKAFEPKHVAVAGVADNHRSARSGLQQADPPQDQGAHNALANLGLGDEHRPHAFRWDDQRCYGLLRARIDQGRAAGELR